MQPHPHHNPTPSEPKPTPKRKKLTFDDKGGKERGCVTSRQRGKREAFLGRRRCGWVGEGGTNSLRAIC